MQQFDSPTALLLSISSDPDEVDQSNSEMITAPRNSENGTHLKMQVRTRAKTILDAARTSLEAAAATYYAQVDDAGPDGRPDIPADQQMFMEQQEEILRQLSQQCDLHVQLEQRTLRAQARVNTRIAVHSYSLDRLQPANDAHQDHFCAMISCLQVLSVYYALHTLPETLCSAHISFGLESIHRKLGHEESRYRDLNLELEYTRKTHQQEMSELMMTMESTAQLQTLMQVFLQLMQGGGYFVHVNASEVSRCLWKPDCDADGFDADAERAGTTIVQSHIVR